MPNGISSSQGFSALTTEAAWIVDSHGLITFWNSKAEHLFGYAASEVLGQNCAGIMIDCQWCRKKVAKEIPAPHPPFTFRIGARHKDGSHCHIKLTTIVLVESGSYPNGFTLHIAESIREPTRGLRIHLLGPVAVERADGTVIHGGGWSRTKVRGLLAILALERGLPVHRERLTEELWPSLDYRSARQNLNSTVYDLRQSLAMAEAGDDSDSPVLYESNQYSLRWSSCDWLDVVEFERLVHQARQASSPYQKVFQFRQALNLYREEFLSDVILVFANDYYLREQRRIQGLYLDTLEELGILEEGLGRNESAHELFARVLALDPCREQTSRRLMNLFLKAGERTAAVALFQELAKTLRSELGTVPDHETYQLFDAALNGH